MPITWKGFCPICKQDTVFSSPDDWYREQLVCTKCPDGLSIPRERALVMVLERLRPGWRELAIHESSPNNRGPSVMFRRECPKYVGTQFFKGVAPGSIHENYRCEDLENQTFADATFDIVITQDVFEHLFHPDKAYQEIFRTLRPGGIHIHTTGVWDMSHSQQWARLREDGAIEHLHPPEYHGNPIDDANSIVTYRYGYDLPDLIARWTDFSVELCRWNDRHHGIVGAFTDVIICYKPEPVT
jgi:SAM-dependent methyltransferase